MTRCDDADVWLCGAAQAAYSTPATLTAGGDVHVVLSEYDGATVVAFRGTVPSDWHDWFRDFAAWPERLAEHPRLGRCHDGFLSGAVAMLPQLIGVLRVSRPFILTGHSLGGALAIATAALLVDGSGFVPARLTTFGAPRVGIGKMFNLMLAEIAGCRYRHGHDPVPEVPSWPYLNDRAWTTIGAPSPNPIDDHAITGYLAAMN